MIELPCPESRSYLIEARTSAGHREKELRVKETADPRTLLLSDRAPIAFIAIEGAIVRAQRGTGAAPFLDLSDADILAAVENATKNLETEEGGLIYEHRTATPRIDDLSRGVTDSPEQLNKNLPLEPCPPRSDVIRALNFTRDAVIAHTKRPFAGGEGGRSYMRFT